MRPSHRAAGGKLFDAAVIDGDAETFQTLDHSFSAMSTREPKRAQARFDMLVERIEGIRQDVNVVAFVSAGEFYAGDEFDIARIGIGLTFEVRRQIIVIAERDELNAVRACDGDHFARRTSSIRVTPVRLPVGAAQRAE